MCGSSDSTHTHTAADAGVHAVRCTTNLTSAAAAAGSGGLIHEQTLRAGITDEVDHLWFRDCALL